MIKFISKKIKQLRCKHNEVKTYERNNGYDFAFEEDQKNLRYKKCTDCGKIIESWYVDGFGYKI